MRKWQHTNGGKVERVRAEAVGRRGDEWPHDTAVLADTDSHPHTRAVGADRRREARTSLPSQHTRNSARLEKWRRGHTSTRFRV